MPRGSRSLCDSEPRGSVQQRLPGGGVGAPRNQATPSLSQGVAPTQLIRKTLHGRTLSARLDVNKLWFNVKLGPAWWFVLGTWMVGCGYAPAYGGSAPTSRLSLHLLQTRVAEPEIVHEVLAGAREELGRADADADDAGFPRLVVEILRIDESPRGIAALPTDSGLRPRARGNVVGVVGRAWVIERPGAAPVRDTGDVRRVEGFGTRSDRGLEMLQFDAAARAAARELGAALVRRVLGEPSPTLEPM